MASTLNAVPQIAVPFLDLKQQYQALKQPLGEAIQAVLDSATYIQSSNVEQFEHSFAQYCGVNEAIAVDSGTAALHLALVALNVKPGDEIVLPTNTFIATAAAVHVTGARPVFIDADPDNWQMDLEKLSAAISSRCRAVIAVHLYGQPLFMTELERICAQKRVPFIEDAAQAHGARFDTRKVGSFGRAACFSFYPGKNLGAFGDGGMITTNDPELAVRLRRLRDHGRMNKYEHQEVGFNFRMDEIQGAVLSCKLGHLDEWNRRRRFWAAQYRQRLAGFPVQLAKPIDLTEPVYHLFTTCCNSRDALAKFLAERGIQTGVHYPIPLHLQPAFGYLGYSAGDFPNAESISRTTISLPVFPEMTEEQFEHVIEAISDYFNRNT